MADTQPQNIKFTGNDLDEIDKYLELKRKEIGTNTLTRQQAIMIAISRDSGKESNG